MAHKLAWTTKRLQRVWRSEPRSAVGSVQLERFEAIRTDYRWRESTFLSRQRATTLLNAPQSITTFPFGGLEYLSHTSQHTHTHTHPSKRRVRAWYAEWPATVFLIVFFLCFLLNTCFTYLLCKFILLSVFKLYHFNYYLTNARHRPQKAAHTRTRFRAFW